MNEETLKLLLGFFILSTILLAAILQYFLSKRNPESIGTINVVQTGEDDYEMFLGIEKEKLGNLLKQKKVIFDVELIDKRDQ